MTTASPTKAQERHDVLDQYSQETVLTSSTYPFDLLYGMSVFECGDSPTEFIGNLEWVAEKYLSHEMRVCTFAGLNIGDQRFLGKDFKARIEEAAHQLMEGPKWALSHWRQGIMVIAESYEDGMRLKKALELIRNPATSPEAAEALRWLSDEYITAKRLT